ncbi:MAG: valine--tRNA ligase [Candidatus Acetothermia bacterium]
MELSKRYDPRQVEEKRYREWEENHYFRTKINSDKKPFSMVIPPPNVTSELHVGHALQFTLHDIVIRYQRMLGKSACWFPGMDHAGIATQNVVEKNLREEGLTRHDLGRKEFEQRVWEWKDKYGGKIRSQLKALGCSPDWSRERFTLDEGLSRAVEEAFIQLYEKDLIYRDKYIINWCPRCNTALSDIEVEHQEEGGQLYWIDYPLEGSDETVTIATTRPETMLGDTALAIHPQDERAEELVGKTALLPLVGRRLPIVRDEAIDPEFGTGILKVTPAHDPTDFEIGNRHGLEALKVIDREGKIEFKSKYKDLDRYEARKQIVTDLETEDYLRKKEDYRHSVGHCQRCDTVVEPTVSTQWFIEMEGLAKPAIEAVREDEVKLIPERWKKVYFEWMENIQDWCISRQLWWGHRIPAWYCEDCDEVIVSRSKPEICPNCESKNLYQDKDVLDTWFSSALWPFSVMGWPEDTEELDYYFPTDLLITGFDIIFFWVARMIMMSLHFKNEIPFREVLLTPLVLDENGEKMSSSKGNILDPLEIKEEYGADALRFTMASSTTKGRGMKLSEREIEDKRNFLNKLWNASRLILSQLEGDSIPDFPEKSRLKLEDRWILSRYNKTIDAVIKSLENYDFKRCSSELYDFFWKDFCDWYLELVKPRLYSESADPVAEKILYHLLNGVLRALHPFIPFITEEIWNKVSTEKDSIMCASFPGVEQHLINEEVEVKMKNLQDVINAARSIRSEMNVPENETIDVLIHTGNSQLSDLIEEKEIFLRELVKVGKVTAGDEISRPPQSARRILENAEVLVPLEGVIDIPAERRRIREELSQVQGNLERTLKKLNDEDFLTKAPEEVVEKEKKKREEFAAKKERLVLNLEALED